MTIGTIVKDSRPTTSVVTKPKPALPQKVKSKDSEDADKEAKKKKREENKQKRLEVERKRKAELAQAKENVKYFAGQNPPLPTFVSPVKTPLQPLNLPSNNDQEPLLQPSSLKSKESPRSLPYFLVRRTQLPSSPKKPRPDFGSALESLSSSDESDGVEEVMSDALTAVRQTCPKCPTLKQNIVELQEKIIVLKRKLKETKKQLQDKESGVYIQVNFVKIMPNCSVI